MRRSTLNRLRYVVPLIAAATVGCSDKPSTTSTTTASPPAATSTPPKANNPPGKIDPLPAVGSEAIKITADALTKEVIADTKAAQAKYNGKIVELDGRVDSAKKLLNGYGFSLQGAKEDPTDIIGVLVMCKVPREAHRAWWLMSGQRVKATGTVRIADPPRMVVLDDCKFELQEPAAKPLAAKDLAEAVLKDADAVRKKYQNPEGGDDVEIMVKGTVAELEKNDRGFRIVKLAGSKGVTINFAVDDRDFAALEVGDVVIMKGDFSGYNPQKKGVTVNTAFVLEKE
jgi:hypothetical protein